MVQLQTPTLQGCWVDVYADPTFGGTMHRLSPSAAGVTRRRAGPRLSNLGSMVVGPHAVARVRLAGRPAGADIAVPPGTLVPDLSKLCRTDLIVELQVESLI
jgi:hypothetical protein